MHTVDMDLSMDRLTKVEGSAALDVKVRGGKVVQVQFKITEFKRFFTQAMQGKPIAALPQLLARICGTCSNAHLLCSIEACERALGIVPTPQSIALKELTMAGLNIRDHALHLYLFSLPDIYGKDAFLDFDENDPEQHQLLHDGFEIKSAGNYLATLVSGRSVHALYPTIGGFLKFPESAGIAEAVKKLQAARPAVLRLIDVFLRAPFHFDRQTNYMALLPERYGFVNGCIQTGKGLCLQEDQFRDHLEKVVLPYSQASAYRHRGESYMVGALARMNLAKDRLHAKTKADAAKAIAVFPSTDIFHNNLAQAIEILHCVDASIDALTSTTFAPEPVVTAKPRAAVGVGVVEAPRGTLYHKVELGADGIVQRGEIVVPTGQNQFNIEDDVRRLVEDLLPDAPKEKIVFEIEKLIRAYDPCMSCGSHFLKVNWDA
ncbi:MAG: nickel-dependent hydrogenase large subunit [bacterium]|nr:nickel-dependent hydrogenase large subunit [bacterium]